MGVEEQRFGITEAARLLDRSPSTLRSWDRNESMPKRLRPGRDEAGRRYWTPSLIEEIKDWIAKTGFYPGRGIAIYNPSPEQAQAHIEAIRRSLHRSGEVETEVRLRESAHEALFELGVDPQALLAHLPTAAAELGIPLSQAMVIVSAVVDEYEEDQLRS